MSRRRLVRWVAILLVALFVANVVLSVLLTALSVLRVVVLTGIGVVILGGILYALIKLSGLSITSDSDQGDARGFDSVEESPAEHESRTRVNSDRLDTLREQYANGELDDEQLTRELDQELGLDDADRERESEYS